MLLALLFAATAATPRIKVIDFYGLRKVPGARVERELGFHEGDSLPETKEAIEQRLAKIPGVRAAHVSGTCCYEGGFVIWVGIEENGAPRLTFRNAPTANVHLPDAINQSVDEAGVALEEAVSAGRDADDISHGYSLMVDPKVRAIQERFVVYAKDNLPVIREVLWNAASDRERAHAAQVIAYAPDARSVIPDLVHAIDDPSDDVRNTAMRALAVMGPHTEIPAKPFVRFLNSPVWTDRNKSLAVLANVHDRQSLALLRAEALHPLIEAARWKIIGYARPALFILGRIGGVEETTINQAIETGDREALIAAATKSRPLHVRVP